MSAEGLDYHISEIRHEDDGSLLIKIIVPHGVDSKSAVIRGITEILGAGIRPKEKK